MMRGIRQRIPQGVSCIHSVNQNTTDPEGYTQVNVTPAQEDLIEPVRLIDRGLARDQLTVQVQLEL